MRNRFKSPVALMLVLAMFTLTGCENGNLFGGLNDRGGDGSVASLLADAQVALDSGDYSRALSIYEEVLAKDGDNSEAIYGYAASALGASGLDFGTLLSNIISQQGTSSVLGLADFIDLAKTGRGGYSGSAVGSNVDSILANIDLNALNNVIDCVLYRLNLITAGLADGTISTRDVDLLINFGITCLIRGILRPLREAFLDLKNVNGTLVVEVNPTSAKTFCDNPANSAFIQKMAADAASSYALINEAVSQLGLTGGSSILVQIRDDMNQAVQDILTSGGTNGTSTALPQSCIDAMAPVTLANFTTEGAKVFSQIPTTNPCP